MGYIRGMEPGFKAQLFQEGGKVISALLRVAINRPKKKVAEEEAEDITVSAQSYTSPVQPAAQPLKQSPPSIALPTSEETTTELKRRLARELYRAELDLAAGLKIAGKPCDCLPPGSLVYVSGDKNTVLPIEQIYKRRAKGIFTHEGPGTITAHMARNYSGEIYRFRFAYNNIPLGATPEHPFHIAKDGWKWNWRNYYGGINETRLTWVPSADIGTDDFIAFPRYTQVHDMDIITPDLAELLGWYLAEGHKQENRISISLGKHEKEYVERVKGLILRTYGSKPKLGDKETATYLDYSQHEFTALFDVFGHTAPEKRIPEWVLYLPQPKQACLLRGLFMGDGSFTDNHISYATVSQQLAYQLRFMLFRLGIIHSLNMRWDSTTSEIDGRVIRGNYPVYQICISGDALVRLSQITEVVAWKHIGERTARNWGWVGESVIFLPLRKINVVPYEGRVYNMSVFSSESYLTPYGSVHNCLTNKHTLMLEAISEELISQDPGNPVYQDIIGWIGTNRSKVSIEGIHSGKYAAEYPHMSNEFKNFRKRVMGTVGTGEGAGPSITLEQAKKLAAEEAAKEVERQWKK
jgi:hypothetical protein